MRPRSFAVARLGLRTGQHGVRDTLPDNVDRSDSPGAGGEKEPGHYNLELASVDDLERQWQRVAPAWNHDRDAYDRYTGRPR